MATFLKLIVAVVLVAVVVLGLGLWDLAANDGRLMSWLAGRRDLVADCTPPLRDNLVGKGFSPVDIAFDDDQSIGFSSGMFGRRRSLSGSFSFSDGQDGPRVDGHMLCTIERGTVQVEVSVDELPHRVT